MANRKIETMYLKELFQLKAKGYSNRRAGEALGISRNTVNEYVQLFRKSGRSFEELSRWGLAQIKKLEEELSAKPALAASDRHEQLKALAPFYLQELKRPGCTYQHLWYQYKEAHPEGYGYTQFKHHVQAYAKNKGASFVVQHKYGDKLFIDFTGQKLKVVDRHSGEVEEVEVFIALLGGSQYTYVEACPSQSMEHFIRCTVNCLEFIDGVPQALVPDNLKAAVNKASNYEPLLNRQYQAMGLHYNTVVVPARAGKPRDKALVEGAVKLVYQRVFYPLRNHIFFSLAELNEHIRALLGPFNEQLFQGRGYSRKALFAQHERALLAPLPAHRFEPKSFKKAKVQKNAHVWVEKHYYSVPYRYIGKQVEAHYNALSVEVYYQHERIALHRRSQKPHGYTSLKEHLPSTHQFVLDWNPELFIRRGQKIGEATSQYIKEVMEFYSYPEQAYKSCMGILSLAKKYSAQRLEKACARALKYEKYSYRTIETILFRKLDQLEEPEAQGQQRKLPLHDNIRGADYYE